MARLTPCRIFAWLSRSRLANRRVSPSAGLEAAGSMYKTLTRPATRRICRVRILCPCSTCPDGVGTYLGAGRVGWVGPAKKKERQGPLAPTWLSSRQPRLLPAWALAPALVAGGGPPGLVPAVFRRLLLSTPAQVVIVAPPSVGIVSVAALPLGACRERDNSRAGCGQRELVVPVLLTAGLLTAAFSAVQASARAVRVPHDRPSGSACRPRQPLFPFSADLCRGPSNASMGPPPVGVGPPFPARSLRLAGPAIVRPLQAAITPWAAFPRCTRRTPVLLLPFRATLCQWGAGWGICIRSWPGRWGLRPRAPQVTPGSARPSRFVSSTPPNSNLRLAEASGRPAVSDRPETDCPVPYRR